MTKSPTAGRAGEKGKGHSPVFWVGLEVSSLVRLRISERSGGGKTKTEVRMVHPHHPPFPHHLWTSLPSLCCQIPSPQWPRPQPVTHTAVQDVSCMF